MAIIRRLDRECPRGDARGMRNTVIIATVVICLTIVLAVGGLVMYDQHRRQADRHEKNMEAARQLEQELNEAARASEARTEAIRQEMAEDAKRKAEEAERERRIKDGLFRARPEDASETSN